MSQALHRSYIWPWNKNSESAKALAEAMGILRVKSEGSSLTGAKDLFIINFGSGGSYFPSFLKGSTIINDPNAVLTAINKIAFFEAAESVAGLRIPEWTTSITKAKAWINKGEVVLCRKLTEGSNGEGIVVAEKAADLVTAPLYTQFVENSIEFRLYVVGNEVVFACTKDPKSAVKQTSMRIRTHDHGWAYNYYYNTIPADAVKQALLATKACGLDFSGVDLIMSGSKAYVLEVNTAPWMNEKIAPSVGQALQKLLISKGAKLKSQVEAAAPVAAAAPALTPAGNQKFTATFIRVNGGWGVPAGTKHVETIQATDWTTAAKMANLNVQPGWALTELKAA